MTPVAGSLQSSACGECHTEIYRAWLPSAHARAHVNPLYLADFRHQGEPYPCEYCHTPLVEQRAEVITGIWIAWPRLLARSQPNPRHQVGLRTDGVGCVSCHQRDGAMVGPFEAISSAPHPTAQRALGVETCRPCHHLDLKVGSELSRPIQDTFGEWEQYRRAGGEKTCVECHMPRTAPRPVAKSGPPRLGRDHRLKGPRDIAFLRSGVVVRQAELDTSTGSAAITLVNGSGHRIPTAEPQRRLEVALEALDAAGRVLARSSENIQRVVLLPRMIEESDTTLLPLETRTLRLQVSTAGAARVRARVTFHFWDPDHIAAIQARIAPKDLRVEVFEKTWQLSPE